MSFTLYTLGYASWNLDEVATEVRDRQALLVDVRLRAASSKPGFYKKALMTNLGSVADGGAYVHLPEFGNVSYRSGGVNLRDPAEGLHRLLNLVEQRGFESAVLMCGCKDYRRCHRTNVAGYIMRMAPVTGAVAVEDLHHLQSPRTDNRSSERANPELSFPD